MGHHIVEIDPDPKPVGRFNQILEFSGGAVLGGDGSALVLVPKVETVKGAKADVPHTGAFERRGKPKGGVASLRQLRNFHGNLVPGGAEVLEDCVRLVGLKSLTDRAKRTQSQKGPPGEIATRAFHLNCIQG